MIAGIKKLMKEVFMSKKAFTLAEVLITLMIIGIVAALTIPSVISNYQQQEFKTGLKKAVSVLNEAIQTNIALDGETPYENGDLANYLQRHMSVLSTRYLRNRFFYYYSGSHYGIDALNYVFYTTDGMRFEVRTDGRGFSINGASLPGDFYLHESGLNAGNPKSGYGYNLRSSYDYGRDRNRITYFSTPSGFCGSYGLNSNPNNTINTPCVIMVDINGDKKPNPSISYKESSLYNSNGVTFDETIQDGEGYSFPSPSDKKLTDVFTIMITDEKAIPFGVVAQRAMYSK